MLNYMVLVDELDGVLKVQEASEKSWEVARGLGVGRGRRKRCRGRGLVKQRRRRIGGVGSGTKYTCSSY